MSQEQWVRISPRTGKPVRKGGYKAGPGRGNHAPARSPAILEEVLAMATEPSDPAMHSAVMASDAHSLLRAIYCDTSLPLYARVDAARVAIRHEVPMLTAAKVSTGAAAGLAERLRRARERVQTSATNMQTETARLTYCPDEKRED